MSAPEEGLTEYERWQVAVAIAGLAISIAFTLWIMLKDDASVAHRLRWWREQQRKRAETEAEFTRWRDNLRFDLWLMEHGAPAE